MSEVYFSNSNLLIRSMEVDDAKIIYDTYLSYGWHPSLETYDNYYKEQEENKRKVFIAEYEGKVSGLCTLVLNSTEGPWAGMGYLSNYKRELYPSLRIANRTFTSILV